MQISSSKKELAKWAERLRNPLRLQMALTLLFLVIGYFAIYSPIYAKLTRAKQRFSQEQRRQQLQNDVDFLQAQLEMFDKRIPRGTDTNEWVQYVINGIRKFPVTLVNFDTEPSRRVSPYRAVAMRISVEAEMQHIDSLLFWLETDERIFRIESAKILPSRDGHNRRALQITLLGLKV